MRCLNTSTVWRLHAGEMSYSRFVATTPVQRKNVYWRRATPKGQPVGTFEVREVRARRTGQRRVAWGTGQRRWLVRGHSHLRVCACPALFDVHDNVKRRWRGSGFVSRETVKSLICFVINRRKIPVFINQFGFLRGGEWVERTNELVVEVISTISQGYIQYKYINK